MKGSLVCFNHKNSSFVYNVKDEVKVSSSSGIPSSEVGKPVFILSPQARQEICRERQVLYPVTNQAGISLCKVTKEQSFSSCIAPITSIRFHTKWTYFALKQIVISLKLIPVLHSGYKNTAGQKA